jgi:hypothetical protein
VLADQAFCTDCRPPAEVGALTVDHIDALDRPIPTFQIERLRTVAAADDAANVDIIGIAIAVDDLEVQYLDVVSSGSQANCFEPAFTPPDPDRVAVPATERNLLASELHPLIATSAIAVTIASLGHGIGHEQSSANKRTDEASDKFEPHI